MRRLRLWTRSGISRRVFISARWAVKAPRLCYGADGILRGMLANRSESSWSDFSDNATPPNPVVLALPFGIANVYRRALPFDGEMTPGMFGVFGDEKRSNLGVVDGRVVVIDFDMHCCCWLQCREHGPAVSSAAMAERVDRAIGIHEWNAANS